MLHSMKSLVKHFADSIRYCTFCRRYVSGFHVCTGQCHHH